MIRDASDLTIKKGAFNNIKHPRKTDISIYTTNENEFEKIVENFKNAGGEKLRYKFYQLDD